MKRKKLFVLYLFFIFTISKSIRLPNDWSEAHWMIGYQFGFIKRGLPGAILNLFFDVNSDFETIIIILSFVIFAVFSIALILVTHKILLNNSIRIDDLFICSIFLTSGYIVMSAHLVGYYDNILVLLLLFSLYLIQIKRFLLSFILLGISVLIHETTLVLSLPIVLFHLYIKYHNSGTKTNLTYLFKVTSIPLITFILLTVVQYYFKIDTNAIILHLENFPFIHEHYQTIVPDAFTHSFFDYLKNQLPSLPRRLLNKNFIVIYGIPTVSIFFLIWKKMNTTKNNEKQIFIIYILTSLLPLSLHAIAWDTSRIWSYILITSFLGYFSLKINGKLVKEHATLYVLLIFLFSIGINFILVTPLMDEQIERYNLLIRIISFLIFSSFIILGNKKLITLCKNALKPILQ
jgi:hypothetical protein